MKPAPTTAPVHLLAPDLAVWLGQFLTALFNLLGVGTNLPLQDRLHDAIRQFEALMARHAAGLPDLCEPDAPCPGPSFPRPTTLPTATAGSCAPSAGGSSATAPNSNTSSPSPTSPNAWPHAPVPSASSAPQAPAPVPDAVRAPHASKKTA